MNEAQHGHPGIEPVGLVSAYRAPLRAVRLTVIRHDHADVVAAAREGHREQCLLDRLAVDVMLSVLRCQDGQRVEADETDLHRPIDPSLLG